MLKQSEEKVKGEDEVKDLRGQVELESLRESVS